MTPTRLRDWQGRLAAVHRYLGIGLCLLFAMWFASGAVMVFQPYPAQTEAERFACLEPIDLPADFRVDGLAVFFEANERTDLASICQVGRIVELDFIQVAAQPGA